MLHLYEVVFESSSMWLKVQVSGDTLYPNPALLMLETRFGGVTVHNHEPSFAIPFRLSEHHEWIHNWEAITDRLPPGWDDHKFRLAEGPYPWCETLSDGCDCHAMKGGWTLLTVPISDFRMR